MKNSNDDSAPLKINTRSQVIAGKMLMAACLILLALTAIAPYAAQNRQRRQAANPRQSVITESSLNGVYRFDPMLSDKLYSVVSEAATNLPYGKQQRFFDDLMVRLSSPDQLAIEQRGSVITIASSRAPRVTVVADGGERTEKDDDGHAARIRAALEGERLVIMMEGDSVDPFHVSFEPLEGGRKLRVTRRIAAEQLNQPLVVRSIYKRVSQVARWSIFEESPVENPQPSVPSVSATTTTSPPRSEAERTEGNQAQRLRAELYAWIEATNARDINKQMDFYLPRLDAFYLSRNAPRRNVRLEKERVFARAGLVDIRAAEPEIIFRDSGRTAVMRFRKQYEIENTRGRRGGEVVQELHWRLTPEGWKIASERDVRVLR